MTVGTPGRHIAAATAVAAAFVACAAGQARAAGWEIQPSPSPAGAVTATLYGVSCASGGSCMAVGTYSPDGKQQLTLAERWDGIAWRILPTPNQPGTSDRLFGVSCPSASSCAAVGQWVSGAGVHTLAEIWNGRRWTLTPTPPPNPQELSSLTAVSCDAPGSCTAVGGLLKTSAGAQTQPFALHWDGSRWTSQAVPIPPEGEQGSGLQGVSCASASACTAVGIYYYNDIDQGVFSVRFDGSAWSLQRQPNPKGENLNAEYAVSCAAATSCMAVGSWLTRLGLEVHTLAEVWNGGAWTRLSTPRPAHAVSAVLNGVSCVSPTACAAAGESSSNSETTPTLTLIEEWNGAGWALRPSPSPAGAQSARLAGVSCEATGCVAVGSASTPSVTQTLVERNGP